MNRGRKSVPFAAVQPLARAIKVAVDALREHGDVNALAKIDRLCLESVEVTCKAWKVPIPDGGNRK